VPRSEFSEVNSFLSNLLGWGELFQTTWCGSGGSARYTILAPTNEARRVAGTAHHAAGQQRATTTSLLDSRLMRSLGLPSKTLWVCCLGNSPGSQPSQPERQIEPDTHTSCVPRRQ